MENGSDRRYAHISDAARYLGTTESALRNRIHRGTIPFLRDGIRIVFDLRQLDREWAKKRVVTRGWESSK
jgi:excisionase family DNA binding protein